MKRRYGFLHAGEASRVETDRSLAAHGYRDAVEHLVDATLVEADALELPIDDRRYEKVLGRARELRDRAERIVLTCSAYNGVASLLAEDLSIPVERSDAAGARALLPTTGSIGILVSYPPTRPLVVDYVSEILAQAEQQREIASSVAEDAPPFTTPDDVYREKLIEAMRPLRECGVLLVAQYSMNAHLPALRAAWGERPMISALDAMVEEIGAA